MKNRDTYWRRYKKQETLYLGQWRLSSLQSRHPGMPTHKFPQLQHDVPCALVAKAVEWILSRSYVKILATVVFGIPRSASSSHTVSWSLLIAACTHSLFSGVLLVAGLPGHGLLSTDSRPSLKHLCHTSVCALLIKLSLKAFWILQIVSVEECSSLTWNLMQICCSTSSFDFRKNFKKQSSGNRRKNNESSYPRAKNTFHLFKYTFVFAKSSIHRFSCKFYS